jgi:uncharacterized protein YndB with AHSA1/START domain
MNDQTRTEQILLEVTIAAPLATVWHALRDPAVIRNWFGWNYEGLEGEIDYIFRDHVAVDDAAHRLTGEPWEGVSDSIVVAEAEGGTRLTVLRDAPIPEGYDEVVEGWISFVSQLKYLLERKRGLQRRTIRLSGTATEKHRLPGNALGIDGLHDAADGSEYVAELPGHERITGQVWHRARHQIGLVVSEWGEALMVVVNQPGNEAAPYGGGAITISTFGLADDAFAALEAKWRAWWNERYPAPAASGQS